MKEQGQQVKRDYGAALIGLFITVLSNPHVKDRQEILKDLRSQTCNMMDEPVLVGYYKLLQDEFSNLKNDKQTDLNAIENELGLILVETYNKMVATIGSRSKDDKERHVSISRLKKVFEDIRLESTKFLKCEIDFKYYKRILDVVVGDYTRAKTDYIAYVYKEHTNGDPNDLSNLIEDLTQLSREVNKAKVEENNLALCLKLATEDIENIADDHPVMLSPIKLDHLITNGGAIPKGKYVIIGALPGVGKTAYAVQQVAQLLLNNQRAGSPKKRIVFYSAELPLQDIYLQLAKYFWYQNGQYTFYFNKKEFSDNFLNKELTGQRLQAHLLKCVRAFQVFLEASGWDKYLDIKDRDQIATVEDIKRDIDLMSSQGKTPDVILIDYLQILDTEDRAINGGDFERHNVITATIRDITRKYKLVTFALAQVLTADGKDYDEHNPPPASSIKGSRNYTQDADMIITLCKANLTELPSMPETEKAPLRELRDNGFSKVWVSIVKNRIGRVSVHSRPIFLHGQYGFSERTTTREGKTLYGVDNFERYLHWVKKG
ncbi:hypothetical protein CKF54_00345 [Psittacicella hinzii]|uniref:SF4 helicase domain-containing protein n=1 Tax=Psittacicella hinzii TaxID=2028575 RepID=A0A3A1YB65_9GAMM|nr:DnaB-like helicase C-terminal domain-containing protein [Psittacicella hinzii]RIY34479.1 hypothetical protein CKF54_00345 [Psittacicella hinzii]